MADSAAPTFGPIHEVSPRSSRGILPALFVSHGAPTLALDRDKGAQLAAIASSFPEPRAVLVVSAHWESRAPTLGTVVQRPILYDYSGFPEELYRVDYGAPPAADLARRLENVLRPWNVARAQDRGFDHGVWVPLLHMFPQANVPVLQMSLPGRLVGADLVKMGAALAPLRTEGVLILASGSLTHNLRLSRFEDPAPPPAWAVEFDTWCHEVLSRFDVDALADYRRRAPALHVAHPTEEHFLPLLIAVGAASHVPPDVTFPITGFEHRSMSRRAVLLQ